MNILLTASSILYKKDGDKIRVLFVGTEDNTLAFPGGHIDRGEAPITAAIRELQEETGLTGIDLKLFRIDNRQNPWQYHFHFFAEVGEDVLSRAKADDDATFVRVVNDPQNAAKERFAYNNKEVIEDFIHRIVKKGSYTADFVKELRQKIGQKNG